MWYSITLINNKTVIVEGKLKGINDDGTVDCNDDFILIEKLDGSGDTRIKKDRVESINEFKHSRYLFNKLVSSLEV